MTSKPYKKIILIGILAVSLITVTQIWRWYYFGFRAAVTDVVFYGKVIDQDDKPVSEARVLYFISGQFMAAGAGSGFTLTDEQGRFRIQGEGAKIVVQTITGSQIDYNTPTPEKVPYLSGGRNPKLIIEDWDKYTSDDPYVFKAWRVEKYENVKKGYDGYSLLPDGSIYTYDPFDRDRGNRWHDGETDGLIRVSCERGEMAHGRDFQDWRITLTPVDGGIQLTDDIYMNIVPDNGYQPALSIEQQLSSPDYQRSVINQRYFFTAHHGKYYGGLFVHYTPHFRNDQCDIEISYKINLDGSHNLAVKPIEGWKL